MKRQPNALATCRFIVQFNLSTLLTFFVRTLNFQNHIVELWNEVKDLAAALRVPENEITRKQEFYVKMFQHVSYDVQHKILLLTVNHTENNFDQCKLLLLILKKFPQGAITHSVSILIVCYVLFYDHLQTATSA